MPRGLRSARSAHSDSSEQDIDGIVTEMSKLQRQFRIMDGDRQVYSIQAQESIRKQRQEIDRLRKEQEEIQRSLLVCENVSRRQQDSEHTQCLRLLLEQRDEMDQEFEREKQCQQEHEISGIEKNLVEHRKEGCSTSDRQRAEARRTQKAIRTLENKLDRALACFSEQMTKNSHLRDELESLRMERVHFQQLRHRLDKELQETRKVIGEMINVSTAAYEARVEAQSKMTTMKEKAVKDVAQYNTDVKESERVIAHERRLKEFMTTKCSERTGPDDGLDTGRRRVSEQKRTESGEESVETLEEVFQRIQGVTGEEDLDMVVNRFIQVEDRNFALFNYVNEQNNEAVALRDQITQTQGEMEQFRVEDLKQEQQHQVSLRDIDENQKETESQAVEHEAQASVTSTTLEQIKAEVNRILSNMACDRSVMEDTLGSSAGIREDNIMSYLGLVEQKTNELLTMQAFLSSKDIDKDYNPKDLVKFLLGQNPEMLRQSINIQPPVSRVDYDIESSPITDDEEQPLSQEQLRQRIVTGTLDRRVNPTGKNQRLQDTNK